MTETRELILDAAERLFAQRGLDGASLRAITEAAGANLGSIHYYFRNKRTLIEEVLNRRIDEFERQSLAELDARPSRPGRAGLRSLWENLTRSVLDFRRRHQDFMRCVEHMVHSGDPELHGPPTRRELAFQDRLFEMTRAYFPVCVHDQVTVTAVFLLRATFQHTLAFHILENELLRHGLPVDDAFIAGRLADIAVAALWDLRPEPGEPRP